MSIALAPSLTSYFHEVVEEALRTRKVEATEEAASYLVALLSAFAHPDDQAGDTLDRPVTFLLEEAVSATGAERFQKLRTLGDGVLYVTGFFGDHIETKGIDIGYVTRVGAIAYDGAATMLRRRTDGDGENVFGELSQKFTRFVDVLAEVAESSLAQQARGERGLVKLYERWLKTGSSTLAAELGARGLVPLRPSGGTQ